MNRARTYYSRGPSTIHAAAQYCADGLALTDNNHCNIASMCLISAGSSVYRGLPPLHPTVSFGPSAEAHPAESCDHGLPNLPAGLDAATRQLVACRRTCHYHILH
ncbi:hypothetical protein BV25DRAFT_1833222 [Artomyces pyxidatus]|uniref:Uncharacterized protein n=1 Tax=Artomyces pyxidatus TaxID=48021 RepID=A0ACB8SFS7_9AGAM|nr:hypothetical protein BV25DRAFT_1833222 [Artomyces pyxidatus]